MPLLKDELLEKKTNLEDEIAEIKSQLDEARAHRIATGEYAEPEWYARAKAAQRIKAVQLNRINHALSDLKGSRTRELEAIFVDCARITLDPSTFQAIMQMALLRWENQTEKLQNV